MPHIILKLLCALMGKIYLVCSILFAEGFDCKVFLVS